LAARPGRPTGLLLIVSAGREERASVPQLINHPLSLTLDRKLAF
jgi:hypothetical protein